MPPESAFREPQSHPLHAAREPHASGYLERGPVHRIWWEESGDPSGIPVAFLHGGPGAGTSPVHRQFFDPRRYRIVLHDQRGAGRSTPSGSLEDNTTAALVGDLEALREARGISRWVVFGGSWGSTLALAYAQAHPDRVLALVLRGIFLGGADEVDWFMHGMGRFFPEAARAFAEAIPPDERGDLLTAYERRLNDPDPAIHLPAARAWSVYEGSCSTLRPHPAVVADFASDRVALALARIEAHYFRHLSFLAEGELIAGVRKIAGIPATIVQGRYDVVCPPCTADRLAAAWPEARYVVVPDAGHSAFEPGTRACLVATMAELAGKVG
ncbi:MAG TPA: prolyl aminopeptidase [Usitatibacteraceae bacterium]|nr:prolyl aminopeptidase [Usitatibacteraceae bacterium]